MHTVRKIHIFTVNSAVETLEGIVEHARGRFPDTEIIVHKLPINVAAFMNTRIIEEYIEEHMAEHLCDNCGTAEEIILLPGSFRCDLTALGEKYKYKFKLGPMHALDLNHVLTPENIGLLLRLSSKTPADNLIKEMKVREFKDIISALEGNCKLAEKKGNFMIRGLMCGMDFPPRILGEIIDAVVMDEDSVIKRAEYLIKNGAEILDLGCVAGNVHPGRVFEYIKIIREKFKCPVSIDSMNPVEINSAIDAGVDMVLNLDMSNIDRVTVREDCHYVLVPTNIDAGYSAKGPWEKIEVLVELIKKANSRGIKNIILDPILDPPITPGFSGSLVAYYGIRKNMWDKFSSDRSENRFKSRHEFSTIPLLMGPANVTELYDVDTTGTNAILSAFAVENNITFLLVTEASTKARGSVKETRISRDMCFYAMKKNSLPKDLGFDLLMSKSKTCDDGTYNGFTGTVISAMRKNTHTCRDKNMGESGESGKLCKTDKAGKADKIDKTDKTKKHRFIHDPNGSFQIYADHDAGLIRVQHTSRRDNMPDKPDVEIYGRLAEDILKKIIAENLISDLSHAGYLGTELKKAEICLKLGKTYIQDVDVFRYI